ncbi:MFS transporter [Euzebya tangerina]|uniref:MFS transporter n=1 Tax=Euzebya tangerina TaxID=591198 RepID=UPI000E323E47|nr:MFS transporter [Euzebya tangerina]
MADHDNDNMNGFGSLWLATGGANLADGILLAGLPVLATLATTDPARVAGVQTVFMGALAISALPAGVLADRGDRRSILVSSNVVRATLLAGLALLARDQTLLLVVYAVAALGATCEMVNDVTAETATPSLVTPERLATAHSRLGATQIVMNAGVGAPVGAVLAGSSVLLALGIPAALYGIAAGLCRRVRLAPREVIGSAEASDSLKGDVRAGFAAIWGDRVLRRIAICAALQNMANTAIFAIAVLLVIGPMGLPRSLYGGALTALAVGGAVGGWAADRVLRLLGYAWLLRAGALAIGLGYGVVFMTVDPAMSLVALLIVSAVGVCWNVATRVLRQDRVAADLLGRAAVSMKLVALCAAPIGGLVAGLTADRLGVRSVGWVTLAAGVTATAVIWRVDADMDGSDRSR